VTKDYSAEVADFVCRDEAVQIRGGYAYIVECPVGRHYRDAKPASITEDTSEVQHLVIGPKQGL
jgi:alkylation response protein AidB-like acyl-CoA dehydrogenase